MIMCGAVFGLVRVSVTTLRLRSVNTRAPCPVNCSPPSYLRLCHVSFELEYLGRTFVIIAHSLEECVRRLLTWKEGMERKELRVNAGKTKIMICGTGLDLLQSSGLFSCTVCRTGVGRNSIQCNGCKHWVHNKCSGLSA